VVQKQAGAGSGFKDSDYQASGAEIVSGASQLYQEADLIKKVKEPLPPEFKFLRKNHILFCFLHLASPENKKLLAALLKTKLTAIGYETVEKGGRLPILMPMSQIAGALAAGFAAFFRCVKLSAKKGKMIYPKDFLMNLEAIARVYPAFPVGLEIGNAVIYGGGVAGKKAMEFALNMSGKVTVIERSPLRREEIRDLWGKQFKLLKVLSPEKVTTALLTQADVLIGCVHHTGEKAIRVFDGNTLQLVSQRKKKIMVDIAIDQGGNFPESRSTSYRDPLYFDSVENLRFCVPNIPSLCGRGASEALEEVSLAYTRALAEDFTYAIKHFPELSQGINLRQGRVAHAGLCAA
jgi:alanine dehydrogenase